MYVYLIAIDTYRNRWEFDERFKIIGQARKKLREWERHLTNDLGYEKCTIESVIDVYSTDESDAYVDENGYIEKYDELYFVKRIVE